MGDPATASPSRSSEALKAAHVCPRCNTLEYPSSFCDEHRCTEVKRDGTPCKNSRNYPELGVCGVHLRKRPEAEESKLLKRLLDADPDSMATRLLRRVVLMPDDVKASAKFQTGLTINIDEYLAEIVRGGGDKGVRLREAGFTALADALGL